jgi:hypothetical protein
VGELENHHRQDAKTAKFLFVSPIRRAATEKQCKGQPTSFSWCLGALAVIPFVFSLKGLP